MRQILSIIVALSTLLLSACDQIEHRSEKVAKKPLTKLAENKQSPKMVWSASNTFGSAKGNSILRLALTPKAVITAENRGILRSRDRLTGDLLWEKNTKTQITGGPTVVSDYILVGTRDKGLYAYHVNSGDLLWQVPMTGEILAAPAGTQDRVFVHAMDGSVSAIQLSDGKVIWRHSLSTPPIVLRHSSSPVFSGNHVFVGFSNGRLMALHRVDGSTGWEHELSFPKGRSDIQRMADISADPIIENGVLYAVSYQGHLAALQAESGTTLWERELSSFSGFALNKNALYVAESKGAIVAIDRRSGKVLWEQKALEGRRLSQPAVIGQVVVVGDDDGYLHWISATDGSFQSRLQFDKQGIEAPLVVKNNLLYVLGRSGKVAAFNVTQY